MSDTPETLNAIYTSPGSADQSFSKNLPQISSTRSAKDSTTYLGALRKSAAEMQSEINAFLTQKMEEDKITDSQNSKGSSSKIDEAKEEENYGEEVDD